MSSNLVPEITIEIVSLGIKDDTKNVDKIKSGIHMAIILGIRKCLKAAIALAEEIVPESIYRDPPYPISYESEALMDSFIEWLNSIIRYHFTGPRTLKDEYIIVQEWEASYASYVNAMRGVNWSKPGSEGGFIEKIDQFIRTNLQPFIHAELQKKQQGLALLYTVK